MNLLPKVSILLINWNGLDFSRKCIRSLLKTSYSNFEILVLDNGSQNNEADKLINEFSEKIKLIKNPYNIGYAEGMNKLLRYARGEYVMLLNNDMEFSKNWLLPLVEILNKNPNIGACQPKIKDLKNRKNFEYAAAGGGFVDLFGYPFARGRVFSHLEKDRGQYDNTILISWAGVMLIRKKILHKIGLFDPIYFAYAEDVDLCFRIYGCGYKIIFTPKSIVYHYGGGAFGKKPAKKMFFIHRNHLILILKNWDLKLLLLILVPRIILDVISFFYYLLSGYANYSVALLCSYFSLIIMIPQIINSRQKVQKLITRRNIDIMPIYKGSIVWDYFVRGKRTFRQIISKKEMKKFTL